MNSRQIKYNKKRLKILTHNGYVDFTGVSTMGIKQLYRVIFDDDTSIKVTNKHRFFTPDGREIHTRELSVGLDLIGNPNKTITAIEKISKEQTFDIIDSKNHTYFANGLLCHNCEFLSSDAMLLDSLFLQNMTKFVDDTEIEFKIRNVKFYEGINAEQTYLIGVDPATGNGGDFSVIEVYHFPSMRHVAEFRSNTMSQSILYDVLKNLVKYMEKREAMVYFSVENNGVGQGVISLFEADDEPPMMAEFVSEEGREKKGMTTTRKSKLRACVNMKEMLEKGRLSISSSVLLTELKSFVQKSGSYEAQAGSTDDCISALLIVIRILEEIATYEQAAYEKLYSYQGDEWTQDDFDGQGEYDPNDIPLPMSF